MDQMAPWPSLPKKQNWVAWQWCNCYGPNGPLANAVEQKEIEGCCLSEFGKSSPKVKLMHFKDFKFRDLGDLKMPAYRKPPRLLPSALTLGGF
jgi:hypothetical protein